MSVTAVIASGKLAPHTRLDSPFSLCRCFSRVFVAKKRLPLIDKPGGKRSLFFFFGDITCFEATSVASLLGRRLPFSFLPFFLWLFPARPSCSVGRMMRGLHFDIAHTGAHS